MIKKRLLAWTLTLVMAVAMAPGFGFTSFATDQWEGAGTVDAPWLIKTATDFVNLTSNMASYSNYAGKFFKIADGVTSLDFTGITGYVPPGPTSTNRFQASLDGNGCKIVNLQVTVTSTTSPTGLFGFIGGEATNQTIQNLTIGSSCSFTGASNCGGIAGQSQATNTIINNCRNEAPITYNGTANGGSVGGIVGYCNDNLTISSCTNIGTITGAYRTGGIIGDTKNNTISGCSNSGNLSSSGTDSNYSFSGGIIGLSEGGDKISNCSNAANFSNTGVNTGGIAGKLNVNATTEIKDCYNTGTINLTKITDTNIGGIAGTMDVKMVNCYNSGAVTGYAVVGGIAGNAGANGSTTASMNSCYNTGNITSTRANNSTHTGGIVGQSLNALIKLCYNTGTITGQTGGGNVGGIVGNLSNSTTTSNAVVTDCYNTGIVTGYTGRASGIIGVINNAKVLNSYSVGTAQYGCVGYVTGTNSYNNLYYANAVNGGGSSNVPNINGITVLTSADFVSNNNAAGLLNAKHVDLDGTTVTPAKVWSCDGSKTIFADAVNFPVQQYIIIVGGTTYTEYVKLAPADLMNVIVASYEGSSLKDVSYQSGVAVASGSFTVKANFVTGDNIKIMFWDGFVKAKPLCSFIEE